MIQGSIAKRVLCSHGLGVLVRGDKERLYIFEGEGLEAVLQPDARPAELLSLPDRIVAKICHENWEKPKFVDVTWMVMAMSVGEIMTLRDDSPAADKIAERFLRGDDGPFDVAIEDALAGYLGVDELRYLTEERLEQARAALRFIGPWAEPEQLLDSTEATLLLRGAEYLAGTEQDNDAEHWYMTINGQFVRITGLGGERIRTVHEDDAKDILRAWGCLDEAQARYLFGDDAAVYAFEAHFRRKP